MNLMDPETAFALARRQVVERAAIAGAIRAARRCCLELPQPLIGAVRWMTGNRLRLPLRLRLNQELCCG